MIIGIIGSRDYDGGLLYQNQDNVDAVLNRMVGMYNMDLGDVKQINGGGKGSETLARKWAEKRNIRVDIVGPRMRKGIEVDSRAIGVASDEPDYDNYEQSFRERNNRIIAQSDVMVFFWDGATHLIGEAITNCAVFKKISVIAPLL